jgi:hypothetical protein
MGVNSNNSAQLGEQINEIIKLILGSQDLLKLLYYDSKDPLSEADISDPHSLFGQNVFAYPKKPDVQENAIGMVCAYFDRFAKNRENKEVKNGLIIFNVICHVDKWLVTGNIRPYLIIHELETLFNSRIRSILSMGRVEFGGWEYKEWNDKFNGYLMAFKVAQMN